jgi:hypothetical protein
MIQYFGGICCLHIDINIFYIEERGSVFLRNYHSIGLHSITFRERIIFTKVTFKLSLCLFKHHVKSKRSGGTSTMPLLTFALDGGEWSASSSGGLTPGEGVSRTHCRGGWVAPKVGLGAVEKRETSFLQDIKMQLLGNQVTISTELPRILKSP